MADPSLRLTKEQKENFDAWILKNGLRWTAEGGPLAPGGCDVAFIGEYNWTSRSEALKPDVDMNWFRRSSDARPHPFDQEGPA